jgi:hypothetical protein
MNVRRLQGLALILSTVCLLIGLFVSKTPVLEVSVVIGILLFMLGIPAVSSAQPGGWVGAAGIVLLELAALIALGFRLDLVASGLSDSLSLTSAILAMLGALLIGWLTIRERGFPAWVGWMFLAQGVLNFLAGLFHVGSAAGGLPILISVLYSVALVAYGYFIYEME